ncbi:MAG: hypothetical protein DWQ34_20525 [Planctomycetota bacterium]|nr:MAG: hypothetical protein DWQ34_20525 [Planctomycetota bacterium]REJ92257.1 MAG: hypothetical protein DWQ29_05000 [Planctomycetota bacterium]REK29762.1 MAG: hypothetical protein DWQ41_03770 [Planctomycetota bacterium]REK30417.1 MAG: hypothetical protein DWQ45_21265 [Planctomycetota bacterium]
MTAGSVHGTLGGDRRWDLIAVGRGPGGWRRLASAATPLRSPPYQYGGGTLRAGGNQVNTDLAQDGGAAVRIDAAQEIDGLTPG